MSFGVQGVLASYREQTSALRFSGKGAAVSAWAARGKFSADVAFTAINYEPAADGTAVDDFKASQFDARVRYYLASGVSLEAGFTNRTADPDLAAQSVGAIRLGVRGHYLLGPGADILIRANYLGGAKFSGGGSSSLGVEFGLGLSVGKSNGRYRVTGDYEFQRFNRTTDNGSGEVDVPLQQALARIGVAVGF
ncbi:MAG: hypothetical protein HYS40_06990 [Gemmatimonadetes bacterium]|nr:hypothetical protein [Gemmatimonadota bacterium]